MEIKKIKVGVWYETKYGSGPCLRVGGTFPVSVEINILYPIPLGRRVMPPRDVIQAVPPPPEKE